MPSLGLGLGLGKARVLGGDSQADQDADAYADLLLSHGGTDIRNNGQIVYIKAFANALYAIAGGPLDFWMFRSTQNMGTGSVAYSFHGLTGTLVNSPTWGVDGLNCPTGSRMNVVLPASSMLAVYACLKLSALSGLQFQSYIGPGEGAYWSPYLDDNFYNQIGTSFATAASSELNKWFTFCAISNIGRRNLCKNGIPLLTQAGETAIIVTGTKDLLSTSAGPVTASFNIVANQDFSDAQILAIHNAYRNTIGLGLGLPATDLAAAATIDANYYANLLLLNGGADIRANGQFVYIEAFAQSLYATTGRPTDFWMLRSNQNMGTGTTARSFWGEVGNLVGGPTWGINGISSIATTAGHLVRPLGAATFCVPNNAAMNCFRATGIEWPNETYWNYGNQYGTVNQNSGGWVRYSGAPYGVANQMRGALDLIGYSWPNNIFAMLGHSLNASGASRVIHNGVFAHGATVSTTFTPPCTGADSFQIAKAAGVSLAEGTSSFYMDVPLNLSDAQHLAIFNAYGITIGAGLGLPVADLAAAATRDANHYADLLIANGGTNIRANGQITSLISFAQTLYAQVGAPCDFWPLRSTQNMGTGTTARSFWGVVGTLVNGATWSTNGITTNGVNQYLSISRGFNYLPFTTLIRNTPATDNGIQIVWSNGTSSGNDSMMIGWINDTTAYKLTTQSTGWGPNAPLRSVGVKGMDGFSQSATGSALAFHSGLAAIAIAGASTGPVALTQYLGHGVAGFPWQGIFDLYVPIPNKTITLSQFNAIDTAAAVL